MESPSKYFKIEELTSKDVYELLGDNAWRLFDNRLIKTLIALRLHFNCPVVINDWYKNGQFSYRGYRESTCTVGCKTGAHYNGWALDMDFYKGGIRLDPEYIRGEIINNRHKFPYIRGIEQAVNWVHVDIMDEYMNPKRKGIKAGNILYFHPTDSSKNKII